MAVINQSVFDRWDIPDKSVQLIVTSPPYWSMRKYTIPDIILDGDKNCKHEWGDRVTKHVGGKSTSATVGNNKSDYEAFMTKSDNGQFCSCCSAWRGQHGLESSFKYYVDHVRLWAKEAWRVLKDDGIFFLNLGDNYCSSGGATRHWGYLDPKYAKGRKVDYVEPSALPQENVRPKSKMLIPHRVAVALMEDGWILRNDLVWYRPNALPESVTDRYSKKSEYIFMFVKQPKYFFDLNAVKKDYNKIKYRKSTVVKIKNPGDFWKVNIQYFRLKSNLDINIKQKVMNELINRGLI